ncbi:unnamed protein product [Cladocopium goreaui]|uniref:Uncharacterized protein n=1 Tax=Cladocopium goreaui TaxID=2562237 RepID=A0A9P1GA11_9DINO|nr:unnamed protein product [Cladocopium goreaui]
MGPECASWGIPARGTSKRTYINPFGAMELGFVADANECVAKLVLCLLLMMAKHAYFVIEQPANSLLQKAHRFETFINHTCYVYSCRFWMQLHGHGSPKPTICYSNAPWVNCLNLGPLRKGVRLANTVLHTTRQTLRNGGGNLAMIRFSLTHGI